MLPSEAWIGVDQAARLPAASAGSRCSSQNGILGEVGDEDLAREVHAGGARAVADADRACVQRGAAALGQAAGRRTVAKFWPSGASRLTEPTVPAIADSIRAVIEASTSGQRCVAR